MTRILPIAMAFVLAPACTGSCDASSMLAGVRAAHQQATVGPGFSNGFKVACDDADAGADAISVSGQVSYECRVSADGGTVWIGDSAVANDGSTGGVSYAPGDLFGGNVRGEYCRTVTGTTNLFCRALVTSEP